MNVKLMRLDRWAEDKYGDDRPSVHTLRRWCRDGHIYPAPVKHGRSYYVRPDAEYVDFASPTTPANQTLLGKIHESTQKRRA